MTGDLELVAKGEFSFDKHERLLAGEIEGKEIDSSGQSDQSHDAGGSDE